MHVHVGQYCKSPCIRVLFWPDYHYCSLLRPVVSGGGAMAGVVTTRDTDQPRGGGGGGGY